MGVTLTDVLLFGKAQLADVDKATLVIYRRNILRWSALGGYLDIIVKGVAPLSLPDAIANSLSYVKAFGGTEQRNLPDGYIERQFIYMMDGSYLLTDIVPTFAGHYELEMQTTSVTGTPTTYLGGRNESSGNDGLRFAHISDKSFRILGFGNASTLSNTAVNNTKYKFIWDNGSFWVYSGTTLIHSETFTEETLPTTIPLAINGWNTAGTITTNTEGIYLYSFKAWNAQGELIANYVPAVQKGTVPVVGFYDTVSKTFKTATAGTFAAGGEAVPTPDAPMDIVSNNGVLKYSRNKVNVIADNVAVGKYISVSGVLSDSEYNFTYMPYIPVKPNTTYTLTYSSPIYFGSVSEYSSAEDSGFVVQQTKYSTSLDASFDLTEFTFTTGATTNYIRFGSNMYKNQSLTIDDVLALNYMLAESATAVPYTPYVSDNGGIYADGTVETINVHGKNLFDSTPYKTGYYIDASGNEVVATQYQEEYLIRQARVQPSTQYTISFKGSVSGYTQRIHAYDAAGNWLSQVAVISNVSVGVVSSESFTTPANCAYIRQGGRSQTEYQLERGSTATDYVPYYDGGTATTEMLLKVGDYQDVQEILSGAITRNVGIKVLDGTESWTASGASGTNNRRFILTFDAPSTDNVTALCTHINHIIQSSATSQSNRPCIRFNPSGGSIAWYEQDNTTTLEQFTQYLADQYAAGTPVIIVCPLETPTTESVAGQTMQVQQGDNIVEITQASLDNLELEAKYQAAVSLTIQEVQDANLDPNVQVTIN